MDPKEAAALASAEQVELQRGRPLIVCDADEVLVYFLRGLDVYFDRNDCRLDLRSFAIHGNVRRKADDAALANEDVTALLRGFFSEDTDRLDAVADAADALAALSAKAQIVVLSNLPTYGLEKRRTNLARHGMPYPVVAGAGPKGPLVAALARKAEAPTFFLDDLPPHIQSVAATVPDVRRLHFIADERLALLVGPAQDCHARIDDWRTARLWIEAHL